MGYGAGYGAGGLFTSAGTILVLFILLVIVSRCFLGGDSYGPGAGVVEDN